MTPRAIQVIQTETTRGRGVEGDPMRPVMQYHTLEGRFLAEWDSWAEAERRTPIKAIIELEREGCARAIQAMSADASVFAAEQHSSKSEAYVKRDRAVAVIRARATTAE